MTKTNLPRIEGVKYIVGSRDRGAGKVYVYAYHRGTGEAIKARPIGGIDFLLEVKRLDKKAESNSAANEPVDGTLGALIKAYRSPDNPDWSKLADRTRSDYQDVFDYLQRLDDMTIALIDAPFVLELRDKAFAKHKRRFANYVVQVLSLLFAWGQPRRFGIAFNPAAGVPKIKRPRGLPKKNRAWKNWEKPIVMEALPIHVRWPIAIAMYAGLREGDLVAAPRTTWTGDAIDLEAQRKTANPHWMPAAAELKKIWRDYKAWLEKKKVTPMKLCVNSHGKPWTESGLRSSFFKVIRKLVKDGKVQPGLTIHGLRHTIGRDVVDAGGDSLTAAAMIGDVTTAMGEHYSREADQRRRATDGAKKVAKLRARRRCDD